jgi:hypothetical protein
MGDALRGNTQPGVTASAELVAKGASDIRFGRLVQKGHDFLGEILERVAYLMDLQDGVISPLGASASMAMTTESGEPALNPALVGGVDERSTPEGFYALDLKIQSYSTSQTTEQQRQVRQAQRDARLQMIAVLGPQSPFIDWQQYAEDADEADGGNLQGIVDVELMRAWGLALLQAGQVQPPAPASAVQQSRLGSDQPAIGAGRANMGSAQRTGRPISLPSSGAQMASEAS